MQNEKGEHMKDLRAAKLAKQVIEYSVSLKPGEKVLIEACLLYTSRDRACPADQHWELHPGTERIWNLPGELLGTSGNHLYV